MEQQIEERTDDGRPVKPHRSGGVTSRVAIASAVALAASLPTVQIGTRRDVDWWGDRKEPINTGRRAEKDAAALAKAEAKRKRKMAKRATAMPPNAKVSGAGTASAGLPGYTAGDNTE